MKKVISVTMLSIGTMIGAGFASGQEIASFFGYYPSIFVPIITGVLLFAFTYVLLKLGKKIKPLSIADVNKRLFAKAGKAVDIIMLLDALIIVSAMTAGLDSSLSGFFKVALPYGAAFGCLSVAILRFGNKGLLNASTAIVPYIIFTIIVLCFASPTEYSFLFEIDCIPKSLIYVAMNLLLSAGVLVRQNDLTDKEIIASSLLCAIIIGVLMTLICGAFPFASSTEMPMLSLAYDSNLLYVAYMLALVVSIFSTLLSALAVIGNWSENIFGKSTIGMFIALVIGSVIALFGFKKVVDLFYPIIGILGLAYITRAVLFISPIENLIVSKLSGRKQAESVRFMS